MCIQVSKIQFIYCLGDGISLKSYYYSIYDIHYLNFYLFFRGVASKLSAVGTGSAPINGKGTSQMCNSMRGSLIKKQVNIIKIFFYSILYIWAKDERWKQYMYFSGCQKQQRHFLKLYPFYDCQSLRKYILLRKRTYTYIQAQGVPKKISCLNMRDAIISVH